MTFQFKIQKEAMGQIWPAILRDDLIKRHIKILRDCLPLMRENKSVPEMKGMNFSVSTVLSPF